MYTFSNMFSNYMCPPCTVAIDENSIAGCSSVYVTLVRLHVIVYSSTAI